MSEEEKQLETPMSDHSGAVSSDEGATDVPELELNSDVSAQVDESTGMTSEADVSSESDSDTALGVEVGSETLQRENEALKAQLEEIKGQSEALKTQSIRIAADFDNFRKRTSKEKEDLEQQIKRNTITELLPVVDNFERARSHLKPQTDGELAIHKSYQGVYKQLVDCLKRIGVSPMRPEGQPFDPNLHEAVMREATDEYPEGTVIEQLMRGYMLNERVLRHAMVKVAAAGDSGQDADQDAAAAD